MQIYTVRQGDSIYGIANAFGVTTNQIIRDNQLEYPERLVMGQALVIEGEGETHIVRSGESMYAIARAHEIPLESLLNANRHITTIYPGQAIRLPQPPLASRAIVVNGYCYPHITDEVLLATLPFLTFASVFSYEVRRGGTLQPLPDSRVLQRIQNARVAPLMVITNIDESGRFSTELASAILRSEDAQEALLRNIRSVIDEKGYRGLDVDFEYVSGADRDRYSAFLQKLADMLHPMGVLLSTAVAAKTRVDQPGLLYEGVDYAAHGRIVDYVLLMTYDWGYQYGPPMAVSPFHRVEEVVRFAVTQIPSNKVLLGMPNYAYDWALPFAQGNAATLVSNVGAVSLAARTWSNIQFDEESKTPFFHYWDAQRREHVVWFDDARSFQAKLLLVEQYDLAGIGYWNINTLFMQGWLVLASMYYSIKT